MAVYTASGMMVSAPATTSQPPSTPPIQATVPQVGRRRLVRTSSAPIATAKASAIHWRAPSTGMSTFRSVALGPTNAYCEFDSVARW